MLFLFLLYTENVHLIKIHFFIHCVIIIALRGKNLLLVLSYESFYFIYQSFYIEKGKLTSISLFTKFTYIPHTSYTQYIQSKAPFLIS